MKEQTLNNMHILDTFERLGMWSLDNIENPLAGRIKYNKGQTITLHLMLSIADTNQKDVVDKLLKASLSSPHADLSKLQYIHGVLESGERVLLNNCHVAKFSTANRALNVFYEASYMLTGDVDPNTNMEGEAISISYTSLYTWLWPQSLSNVIENYAADREMSFTHAPPKNQTIELPDNFSLEINYGHHINFSAVIQDFTISQSAGVALKSKMPLDLDTLYDKILTFRNFLIIATNTRIQPKSIHLRKNGNTFTVFWDRKLYDKINEEYDIHKMNFNYRQIVDDFENIIKQWFEYYKKYNNALDLYFEAKMDGPILPLNITFLRIVQSLEAFHRIKYGGRKKLKTRLIDLINKSYDILDGKFSVDMFMQQVSDIRHYFSHGYLKNKASAVPSDDELLKMTYMLDLLMFACIIKDSELPEQLKCDIVSRKIISVHQITIL